MTKASQPIQGDRQTSRLTLTELRLLARRLLNVIATLLVIAYLTSFGLIMAERGRLHLPAEPLDAAWQALGRVFEYFVDHTPTYVQHRMDVPAMQYVSETLGVSAGLLLVSLGVAALVGILLGVIAAFSRNRLGSTLVTLFSVLGISTPSFLLAMLFWIINIRVHQTFDIKVLPSAGFGWDAHLIMPALVLAMRPLAQIAQVTYVSMSDVLRQDYIRTARAKGLGWRLVRDRHAMRNILIPVLNTIGASLRFSLASLPVVEIFFEWPGVGLTLLKAVEQGNSTLVTDLILSLGFFFVLVNLVIEFFFPLLDPRLRQEQDETAMQDQWSWKNILRTLAATVRAWLRVGRQERETLPPLPKPSGGEGDRPDHSAAHRRWYLRSFFTNPALLIGLVMVAGLIYLIFAGSTLSPANPYEMRDVSMIEGVIQAPPFKPSDTFPWGTDVVGRDVQALVLWGTRQTMTLAFFGMLARLFLGILLGALAGWWRGGFLDRLVTGAIGVWAAYPLTLFAMLIIQALGIQQGIWVFVVAISIVGWGEVAQFVRGQVVSIKPQLYVESARSVGARPGQILIRHVTPNLVNPLIVLAMLEMGGILMLLAELGFLNIFLGGGFRVMIGETGKMIPVIVSFSDVPEWSALIASVRLSWRSYPWTAWYPAAAFFLSIMAFNLLGDGLRRFLDESQANLSRLFNRYTFAALMVVVVGFVWYLRTSGPLGVYIEEARNFNAQRAMQDIEMLASPRFSGRASGTIGADQAAEYIAEQMEAAGLFPAGGRDYTFIQQQQVFRPNLVQLPQLAILNEEQEIVTRFNYREDFVEVSGASRYGSYAGSLVGLVFGPLPQNESEDPYQLQATDLYTRVVLVRQEQMYYVPVRAVGGLLVVNDDPEVMIKRYLYTDLFTGFSRYNAPVVYITSEVADQLLAGAGTSLAEMDALSATLEAGTFTLTDIGPQVLVHVPLDDDWTNVKNYYNVIGFIPGTGAEVDMDDEVIVVSAYYDGLGFGPDGTFYPGANDNASGVATMLEIARLLTQSPYAPKKTVVFVAWTGGERSEGLSLVNVFNAKPGFNRLNIEAVIELSGVAGGDGTSISIGDDSSSRMVQLFQAAASRFDIPTTTRGRDPHIGFAVRPIFGGRTAMTLSVAWDGSDRLAHTPQDTIENIDVSKLSAVGRAVYLTVLVLTRETEY